MSILILSEKDRFEFPNIRVSTKVSSVFLSCGIKSKFGSKARRVDTLAINVILVMTKLGSIVFLSFLNSTVAYVQPSENPTSWSGVGVRKHILYILNKFHDTAKRPFWAIPNSPGKTRGAIREMVQRMLYRFPSMGVQPFESVIQSKLWNRGWLVAVLPSTAKDNTHTLALGKAQTWPEQKSAQCSTKPIPNILTGCRVSATMRVSFGIWQESYCKRFLWCEFLIFSMDRQDYFILFHTFFA